MSKIKTFTWIILMVASAIVFSYRLFGIERSIISTIYIFIWIVTFFFAGYHKNKNILIAIVIFYIAPVFFAAFNSTVLFILFYTWLRPLDGLIFGGEMFYIVINVLLYIHIILSILAYFLGYVIKIKQVKEKFISILNWIRLMATTILSRK